MHSYEIRIARRDDGAQIVVTAKLLGDHAAIRRAQMLAGPADLVEVWRGATCIYSTMSQAAFVG